MKKLFSAVVFGVVCAAAPAQTPAPTPFFSVSCEKVKPGKGDEFDKLMKDSVHKYAQTRVDSGDLLSLYVLRAVQPRGTSNECDYEVVAFYPGNPPKPLERDEVDALLKKAGVGMSAAEYREKLNGAS